MGFAQPLPHDAYAALLALPANMVGQIVHGVLHAHPRPATRHGIASGELFYEIYGPFRRGRNGPGGWIFIAEEELHLDTHVLVPDISGWKIDRFPTTKSTPYSVVPPDWICEVLSPSTAKLDRIAKLPIYAAQGVAHCWLLDPNEKTLEVFMLANGAYTVGPTFTDNSPVTAVPFEAHTFELGLLWTTV